jgi:8-oxo-dGTP pyrophosphatase MutT (NUDIX family)
MIQFDEGNLRFVYRVAGIAINKDRVLLQKVEGNNFWFLPGGRVEFLEPAAETLKREMKEELGTEIHIVRLLWTVENFFYLNGKSFHELGLYFLMELPENSALFELDEFFGEDDGLTLTHRWYGMEELDNIILHPSFLKTSLQNIPDTPMHIVHKDVEPLP